MPNSVWIFKARTGMLLISIDVSTNYTTGHCLEDTVEEKIIYLN